MLLEVMRVELAKTVGVDGDSDRSLRWPSECRGLTDDDTHKGL